MVCILAKKTEGKIEVLPKPFKIVSFLINGSEQPNQSLNEGDTAVLSWKVQGEDIPVKLLPYGNDLPAVGSQQLPVIATFPQQIILQVVDKYGNYQQRGFAITVIKNVVPTPTSPVVSPSP